LFRGFTIGVYIYCITKNYKHKTAITGREFENDWLKLEKNGTVTVKGTNKNGYAWDGCSPKIKFKDIYFGTPEAVLNYDTGKSKTYYASMIHDILYQFHKEITPALKRRDVDKEFYFIMKQNKFRMAFVYYTVVRVLGWWHW